MPGRTLPSIVKQFYGNISIVKPSAKVITIEPSADGLSMEEVVKLFSMALGQICALKVVDKFVLNNLTKSLRRLKRRPCCEAEEASFGCSFGSRQPVQGAMEEMML